MKQVRDHKHRHAVGKMYRSHRAANKQDRALLIKEWAAMDAALAADKSAAQGTA